MCMLFFAEVILWFLMQKWYQTEIGIDEFVLLLNLWFVSLPFLIVLPETTIEVYLFNVNM